MARTTIDQMDYQEIEDLMDSFLKCNLFYSDRIEFANKFMVGETTAETLESFINSSTPPKKGAPID